MTKKKKLLIFCLKLFLIGLLLYNLGAVVSENKEKYFTFDYWQRFPSLKFIYENSQYVTKTPIGWIPDEIIYSYNGPALVKGGSPILIVPDSPPLGKYLIGLSALIFNNEKLVILFSGFLSFFFLYLLGKQLFNNTILALLPCVFLSFEKLILNQFVFVPLLDIIQLPFLLSCFYFFNKGLAGKKKKQFLYFSLSSILLGCFIATKFFVNGLPIIASFYIVLLLHKKIKPLVFFTLTLPLALLVLILSYSKVFLDGEGIRRFFGIQKWIFLYHQSKLILPFSIWPLILFNKWYVWWGDKPILSDSQWQITWPLVFIVSLLTIALYFLKKIPQKLEFEVLAVWTICYVFFFSFGQITTRYLILYLPILYLVAVFGLKNLFLKEKYGK